MTKMVSESSKRAAVIARDARAQMMERAGELSAILRRAARALERSAAMAEEHAERRDRSGDAREAEKERAAAARATDAARRARARADEADGLQTRERSDA